MELLRLSNQLFCTRTLSILQRKLQKVPHVVSLRSRNIYSDTDTDITELEPFKQLTEEKVTRLPNFLENCPYMSQEDVERLYASFPGVVEDLTSFPRVPLPLGNTRTKKILEHALRYTPYMAAQTVMAHEFYANQRRANNTASNEEERYFLAQKLGWAHEMILRQCCMMDDLIDSSNRRNGVLAWHTLPGNDKQAAQDASVLGTGACLLITKYFRHLDCYVQLLHAAMESLFFFQVSEFELHEMREVQRKGCPVVEPATKTNLSHLRSVRCDINADVLVNTSIVAAMIYNGYNDPELIKIAIAIGNEVNFVALLIDDYGDCFAEDCVTGRTTNDIANGKPTFLLYRARELANSEQLMCLKENYGKKDPACVEKVTKIYEELNVKEEILRMAVDGASQLEDKISKLDQETFPCFIWLNIIRLYIGVGHGTLPRL